MRSVSPGLIGGFVILVSCSETPPLSVQTSNPPPRPAAEAEPWPTEGLVVAAGDELRVLSNGSSRPGRFLSIDGAAITFPAWSADGDRIAISMTGAGSDDPWTIHLLHRNGSLLKLSPAGVYDIGPSFSPDGTRIAFLSRRFPGGDDEIFVMRADGTDRVQLTNSGRHASPGFPAWSPDGQRIAYAMVDVGRPDDVVGIHVITPDGTELTRITPVTLRIAEGQRPAWSPDGGHLAFLTDTQRAIGIVNSAGTHVRHISLPTPAFNLAWSPDGTFIAFNDQCPPDETECPANYIWLVNVADGSPMRMDALQGYAPVWVR